MSSKVRCFGVRSLQNLCFLAYLCRGCLAVKVSGHISINYFVDRLPKKMQHIINRIVRYFLQYLLLVVLYTIPLAESQKNVNSTALAIPLNYFSLSIVVGVIGIVIFMLWERAGRKNYEFLVIYCGVFVPVSLPCANCIRLGLSSVVYFMMNGMPLTTILRS